MLLNFFQEIDAILFKHIALFFHNISLRRISGVNEKPRYEELNDLGFLSSILRSNLDLELIHSGGSLVNPKCAATNSHFGEFTLKLYIE